MEYKVITGVGIYGDRNIPTPDNLRHAKIELEEQLADAIHEGWTPQGGVSTMQTECFIILAQAIIK